MIAQSSLGLTRRVNILADKALLAAFSSGSHSIGAREVKAAIRDCDFSASTHDGRAAKTTHRPLFALVGIGAVAALAGMVWLSRGEPEASPKPATVEPTAAVVGTTLAVAATTVNTPPAAPIAPTPSPAEPLPTIAAPPSAAVTPVVSLNPPPFAKPEPAIAPVSLTRAQAGPLTQVRLESGRAWLQQVANDQWFIQLFATDASRPAEVENLLRNLAAGQSDMDAIHVYYSERSGKPRYGVILGNYATQGAAQAAIRDLPAALQANKPYPRQVARLR
jgi:septal ring-binding cell division protein DamX